MLRVPGLVGDSACKAGVFPTSTSGDEVTAVTGQLVKPGVISRVSSTVKLQRRSEALLYLQSTSNCLL